MEFIRKADLADWVIFSTKLNYIDCGGLFLRLGGSFFFLNGIFATEFIQADLAALVSISARVLNITTAMVWLHYWELYFADWTRSWAQKSYF